MLFQPHSEVPTEEGDWPKLPAILDFQARVRERLLKLYDDIEPGKVTLTRKIARVLFMTLEHEAFHAEVRLTFGHNFLITYAACYRRCCTCCCSVRAPVRSLLAGLSRLCGRSWQSRGTTLRRQHSALLLLVPPP